MDVPLVYPSLQEVASTFDRESQQTTNHVFIKVFRNDPALIGAVPPHLVATLTYLATQVNSSQEGYLSSYTLARDLNVTRETAVKRLRELASLRIGGSRVLTYNRRRSTPRSPVYYTYTLGSAQPFRWDCSRSKTSFTKLYITETRELLAHIEPELWSTILVLGLQMDSERCCTVSLHDLSTQLGTALSSTSERLRRLLLDGWIERVPTPGNEVAIYRMADSIPMSYGAEDRWIEELCTVEDIMAPVDTQTPEAVSGSFEVFNKIKRDQEDNTRLASKLSSPQGTAVVIHDNDEELQELRRLCGALTVQKWLDTVGVARVRQVYHESKRATRSRGGWVRKALEEKWAIPSGDLPSRSGVRELRPYDLDGTESTKRAAQLAGIEI